MSERQVETASAFPEERSTNRLHKFNPFRWKRQHTIKPCKQSPVRVADSDDCWICLSEEDKFSKDGRREKTEQICACPRKVHPSCMRKWQKANMGKTEEKFCKFCNEALPSLIYSKKAQRFVHSQHHFSLSYRFPLPFVVAVLSTSLHILSFLLACDILCPFLSRLRCYLKALSVVEDLCVVFMVLCFIGPFILLVFSLAEGDQLKDKKLYNIYKFVGITLTSIEIMASNH